LADNSQKTPVVRSLNLFAERKIADAIQLLGQALPCSVVSVSGSIVTVRFQVTTPYTLPNVTVPVFGPEYIRYPTQIGDAGVVFPVGASISSISGLGNGLPGLTMQANLSSLVFVPTASKNWSATDDPNAIVLYGPNGGVLRTKDKTSSLVVNENGVTAKVPAGKTMVITSLPTSSSGLTSGQLWNSGGQVMVIP
jgi:hypothetical protein